MSAAVLVPAHRISEIVRYKRAITTDTALRLSRALGIHEMFWINVQTHHDLGVEPDLHAEKLPQVTILVASRESATVRATASRGPIPRY